jgi:hypothetical protein
MSEKKDNFGWSTCPVCSRRWLVTIGDDCLLPSCGCYGNDTSENNKDRPCFHCGLTHAFACHRKSRGGGTKILN